MLVNAWHKNTTVFSRDWQVTTQAQHSLENKDQLKTHDSSRRMEEADLNLFADMKYFQSAEPWTPNHPPRSTSCHPLDLETLLDDNRKRHGGAYSSIPSPKRTRRKQNQWKLFTQTFVGSLKSHILVVQRISFTVVCVRIDARRHRRKSVPHLLTLGHFEPAALPHHLAIRTNPLLLAPSSPLRF